MTCVIPSQSHDISSFLMPVIQCIVAQWRHISSESAVNISQQNVSNLLHMCSISTKCNAQLKAWDILFVLTSVAENLCNKCPSGYSNKTAVKVILSMRSLVSIEQQSPRRPCDSMLIILKPINFVMSGCDLLSTSTAQLHSRSALQQACSDHVMELLTACIKAWAPL